jgi:hypothetical protein
MLMFVYIVEIMFNLLFEFVCKPCACDNNFYFLDSFHILNFIVMDYVMLCWVRLIKWRSSNIIFVSFYKLTLSKTINK